MVRDSFPFFDTIVLPTDAGPNDARIVLDGLNGRIEIYDNNGDLVGIIDDVEGLETLAPDDVNNFVALRTFDNGLGGKTPILTFQVDTGTETFGTIYLDTFSTGATKRYVIVISDALHTGGGSPTNIFLYGNERDTLANDCIIFEASDIQFAGPGSVATPNSANSLPRGEIDRIQATADDALVASTEELFDICILNDIVLYGARKYDVEGQVSFDNTTTRIVLRLRYTTDGSTPTTSSTILEESVYNTVAVGGTGGTAKIIGRFVPSGTIEDQTTFSVGLFLTASAGITALGTGNEHGWIRIMDVGST